MLKNYEAAHLDLLINTESERNFLCQEQFGMVSIKPIVSRNVPEVCFGNGIYKIPTQIPVRKGNWLKLLVSHQRKWGTGSKIDAKEIDLQWQKISKSNIFNLFYSIPHLKVKCFCQAPFEFFFNIAIFCLKDLKFVEKSPGDLCLINIKCNLINFLIKNEFYRSKRSHFTLRFKYLQYFCLNVLQKDSMKNCKAVY